MPPYMPVKARKIPRAFFIAVHPVAMVFIWAILYLVTMGWVWPEGVSDKMYGHVADLIHYLGKNYNEYMMIATLVLLSTHVGGSFLALILCYRLNLRKGVTCLWFFQTLLFGMGSLQYLLNPQNALVNIFCEK